MVTEAETETRQQRAFSRWWKLNANRTQYLTYLSETSSNKAN